MLASLSNLLSGTFHGDTVGEKDTAIGGQHVEGLTVSGVNGL